MRSPKDILMHELIGLKCKIMGAENRYSIGLEGKIVDETMKMIIIDTGSGMKSIPKKGTLLRLKLGSHVVDVEGSSIMARPEDRIKKKIKKW